MHIMHNFYKQPDYKQIALRSKSVNPLIHNVPKWSDTL